jgi:S-adenosylmethionine:tRNA ribosyltransferase-isomerase
VASATMRVDAFDYELPPDLIAQHPLPERDRARLMVVRPESAAVSHRRVSDLAELIEPGSLLIVNDTRVFPARIFGRKRTGGKVEWLLVRRERTQPVETDEGPSVMGEVWTALARNLGRSEFAETFDIAARIDPHADRAPLKLKVIGRSNDDGLLLVLLWGPAGESIRDLLERCGHVPLPPYIRRSDASEDSDRYQTVYARHEGAVAAPTAGLHLTSALLERLKARGCELASLTLHVGLGTFLPVQSADLDQHPMHAEHFELPPTTASAIDRARARRAPVVAVGTTSARALESAADPENPGRARPTAGETRLLIQPGHRWRVVDGLLTNFHQPRSTLMALVCSFAGTERLLAAYRTAVQEQYRFFSYGDAMLLWRAA